MLHYMKLQPSSFEKIMNGSKTIELRLHDEKRQQIHAGDFIEFSESGNPGRKIQTRVTALHPFRSFAELYAALPEEKLGYAPDETPDPAHMDAFYSRERQVQCGALGIELYPTALQRFIDAQEHGYAFGETYQTALAEMKKGRKTTHWIWYVFPQIRGLGRSGTSAYFSIRDLAEAQDYYAHPVLGGRLTEITTVLLKNRSDDPEIIFGPTDDDKVRSCMTLFRHAAPEQVLFQQVLDQFYRGSEDQKTVRILGSDA